VLDGRKLRDAAKLNAPRSLDDGLAETVRFFRQR
jgi:hypothetical protein